LKSASSAASLTYWLVATHPSLVTFNPARLPRPLAMLLVPIALGLLIGFARRAILMTFQPATSRPAPLVPEYGAGPSLAGA
jgi:hypothetical protein